MSALSFEARANQFGTLLNSWSLQRSLTVAHFKVGRQTAGVDNFAAAVHRIMGGTENF
jgi:hypothetical protein